MNVKLIRLLLLILSSLFLGVYAQKKAAKKDEEVEFKKPKVIDGEIV